ncbi:MAG: RagB/SusD family nutrient uptake outer membrane protein [Bacteroidota bacterium]|nr:RagB/SusD family nutrient uptake outer membrane protein [Bacteroidota bacterium]
MKKYLLYIPLALFASCNILDIQPETKISNESAIVDATSLETALTGAYNSLRSSQGASFQSVGYLNGDNVKWTGTWAYLAQFNQHNVRPDNSWLPSVFSAFYNTINSANLVINAAPGITDPLLASSRRKQILGEAYFIRAISYFDFSRIWGGAQLVTKPTIVETDNINIARSSLAETQSFILDDLNRADTSLLTTTNRNKITRKTVWALKARFHLYRQEWVLADTFATRLIKDNANYGLVSPYSAFFANSAANTTESILELQYATGETNGHSNYWQPSTNGGRYEWAPSDDIVTLLNDPTIGGNRKALIAKTSAGKWYGNLYYRKPATDPTYVFRIAEMYLIRAEAKAHENKISEGLADLNAIRSRAGVATLSSTAIASADALLTAIETERRVEFALEPHRWFDLVRTGRAGAVLGVTDTNKWLMPIPQDAINADNTLTPNPGYN